MNWQAATFWAVLLVCAILVFGLTGEWNIGGRG